VEYHAGVALTSASPSRLAYIDWMRGLACVLMFQTHCYDSWLSPSLRQSKFFMYSQLGGTFPAPLFLFLAGISFALVTEKLRTRNLLPRKMRRATIRRGAEIFAFGLLFRLQEYVIAWGWAPLSDLLRVDILNTIGLSMMLMACCAGSCCRSREASMPGPHWFLASAGAALLISLLTPLIWNSWRPRWLPWPLESYLDGVHNLARRRPGSSQFFPGRLSPSPAFPLDLFCRARAAAGAKSQLSLAWGAAGLVLIAVARWFDAQPRQLYAVYDYWHTSPDFFLLRVGMLLMILTASYAWCRWGAGQWGFSPLIQLGQASLLVYWVHIESFTVGFQSFPNTASASGPHRLACS